MPEFTGWLLDVFAEVHDGLVMWWIDEAGARLRLYQPFCITFYAAGEEARLVQLEAFLTRHPAAPILSWTERRDLFMPEPVKVLAISCQPHNQPEIFQQTARRFPDLVYYDADLVLSLRYLAATGVYPLAYCRVQYQLDGTLERVQVLSNPWELDPVLPELRIMIIEPDVDPSHRRPRQLNLRYGSRDYRLELTPRRPMLINLRALLEKHDPDLLLTAWGDTWMLQYLLEVAKEEKLPLPLNREARYDIIHRKQRTYYSYGQVIHRGEQVHLFGRWHIDRCNAMLWGDYGLDGVLELGRVTGLPVQMAARVSPGTGISSMQILTALRRGVLVPWHKQQVETLRPASDLFYADQGGLVYQPLVGLHRNVAEVDFVSMYPSIMVHFNISPETIKNSDARDAKYALPSVQQCIAENGGKVESSLQDPKYSYVPGINLWIDRSSEGLVPETLRPLLQKRIDIKARQGELPAWHPNQGRYKVYASAHKWLLVTCFGYLGYKNARFGRIEAHQAVTAYGREILLRAKEAAEDLGFTVLHLYVDGMWALRKGERTVQDVQPLLNEIAERTGLPIVLDGIFRWVAFLPSRMNPHVPVANRYFGVFKDGTIKVRGIEAQRVDTPPFIAAMQMDMLKILARAEDADDLPRYIPAAVERARQARYNLRRQRLKLEDCLLTLKLSRTLEEYRSLCPAAQALMQLRAAGKDMRPGQRVRFLLLRGEPGVHAWDLPSLPSMKVLDIEQYEVLLLRAAFTILQPFGWDESTLRAVVRGEPYAVELPMRIHGGRRVELMEGAA